MTVSRALAGVPLLCALVALAVLASEWSSDTVEFDRAGARTFTQAALEDAGLEEVEVSDRVREAEYRPRTFAPDDAPLQVFRTTARTEGGTVELLVHPPTGRAVYLRDVATDGGPLLDDDEYRRLRGFSWTSEAEEADRRRLAGTAGTALVVLAAVATSLLTRREKMVP